MTAELSDIPSNLSPPKRYITTHTPDGKSVFYTGVPPEIPPQPIKPGVNFYLPYTTTNFPTELGQEDDIKKYEAFLNGPKPGLIIKGGSVARIVDYAPQGPDVAAAPMHRTISIDYGIVVAGEMEAWLDSGERQPLKVGDIVVQRETNHAWKNPSTTKWARMVFILQEAQPLQLLSGELKEEYGDIPGVAPST